MDYDWILRLVWQWILSLRNLFWQLLVQLYQWTFVILDFVVWLGQQLLRGILGIGDYVLRGLRALIHLNFRTIWNAIKRAYERVRGWYAWYLRTIQEPLDRIRRQIWDIYRRFFKPILMVIDRFRTMVRVVALFDRRLAARLDARLLSLQSALMAPLLAVLRRVNELSSYTRAFMTLLGYLDRVLILETLRRDALLVWEVLTNPLARIFAPATPTPGRSLPQIGSDFRLFLDGGPGHYSDQADRLYTIFEDTLIEV